MPNRDPTICALQQKSKVIVPRHAFPHFSFGESQGVKPGSVWPIKFQRVTHTEILICKAIMLKIVAVTFLFFWGGGLNQSSSSPLTSVIDKNSPSLDVFVFYI